MQTYKACKHAPRHYTFPMCLHALPHRIWYAVHLPNKFVRILRSRFFLYRTNFPIKIRVSKACIFFSTCQIAQFKATICRRCPCQPSTTDTSISPILLRRLLANVSANSLRSNSAPTFALTHKIGQKSPIVCLCLSSTDTICKLLSYCCAI